MSEFNSDILPYIKYLIVAAFKPTSLKFIAAILLTIYSFFFDHTQEHSHVALFFLVLLDFFTGVSAAKATGEKIKSSKIRHTALKMSAYFTMIAAAHLAESSLPSFLQVLDDTVTAFLMVTELISLLENMQRMGYETPKKLLEKLKEFKRSK